LVKLIPEVYEQNQNKSLDIFLLQMEEAWQNIIILCS